MTLNLVLYTCTWRLQQQPQRVLQNIGFHHVYIRARIVRDYETAARCSALQMCGSPRDRNIARCSATRLHYVYKSRVHGTTERSRERPATIEKRGLGAFPRPARAVRARSRLQFARALLAHITADVSERDIPRRF
uniref:Uncharacterized protein n=1 Tax=Trichogramma kaykai TaxID=54128 RepID=A0ABD2VV35_9HYME